MAANSRTKTANRSASPAKSSALLSGKRGAARPARSAKPSTRVSSRARAARSGDAEEQARAVIDELRRLGRAGVRRDMIARYGIRLPEPGMAFGVPMSAMQKIAGRLRSDDARRNHELAAALWNAGHYEARMVACMVDEPARVTSAQMERWAGDFDNWGICDTVCFKLFDRVDSTLAFEKIHRWSTRTAEFQRRAAFALLASVALHDKSAGDRIFLDCLPLIEQASTDDRNFVKKGVSWALRAMSGRSAPLRSAVIELSQRLAKSSAPSARWIGKDAIRQLARGPT